MTLLKLFNLLIG